MKHRIASYLAVAALAFAAQSAHAQVSLIGNFNAASSGSSVDFTNALYLSMRFTTGTTTLAVSAAQATLGGFTGNPTTMNFGLYSDVASNPTALLFSFGSQVVTTPTGTFNDYTFTGSGSFTLAANTTYHLRGNASGGTTTRWRRAVAGANATPNAQNASGIVFESFRRSNNSGSTWANDAQNPPIRLNLVGVVVPEASSLALLGVGCWVLSVIVRRRIRGKEIAH